MSKTILLCMAGLFGACAAYGANIVINPGFETGNFTAWTTNPNLDWSVESSDLGITGPHSGVFYADSGCGGDTCISVPDSYLFQDLVTAINQTYTLTFWYDRGISNQAKGGGGNEELVVLWNGTQVLDLSQATTGDTDPGWAQFTVAGLKASSASTRLEFLGRQDPAQLGIDDINVSAASVVPEPASLGLAGIALLGFGLLAKGRKRNSNVPGAMALAVRLALTLILTASGGT